jgi:hypothetical protein
MNNEQHTELTGHIQGLLDVVFALILVLEKQGAMNASDFAADLTQLAIIRDLEPGSEAARAVLTHLADLIDGHARSAEALASEQSRQ